MTAYLRDTLPDVMRHCIRDVATTPHGHPWGQPRIPEVTALGAVPAYQRWGLEGLTAGCEYDLAAARRSRSPIPWPPPVGARDIVAYLDRAFNRTI